MKIGFIGFGEAAYHISKGLVGEGVHCIYAYDININHSSLGPIIKNRATEANVSLVETIDKLVQYCSIIISATSAKYAASVARDCMEFLGSSHVYVDINATSPKAKEEIANLLEKTKTAFVDAAVMGSIPQHNHKVPILLSGEGAPLFYDFGTKYGMDLEVVGIEPGDASAIKMTRSVFVKGFTMLLFETLQASQKFGIKDYMMRSIENTLQATNLEKLAKGLITRSAVHAERRVAEMDEVIRTLKSVEIKPSMSLATKSALQNIVDHKLREYFDYQPPNNYMDVITALNQKLHDELSK